MTYRLELDYIGDAIGLVTSFRGSSGMVRMYVFEEASDRQVAKAGGGGYDKRGTCLGAFLTDNFQPELLRIASRAHSAYRDTKNGLERIDVSDADKAGRYDSRLLYGMTVYRNARGKAERVRLDGACGWESMVRIAEAIGLQIAYVAETKNTYVHRISGLAKIRDRRARAAARQAAKIEQVPA